MDLIDMERPKPNWHLVHWELLIVLLLVAWLAACSTTYVPTGAGGSSFDQANGECTFRRAMVDPILMDRVYRLCMRQHGWRPQ